MSNVQAKNKAPQIRFKGFEEKWEDGTIDKYGSFYYGRSCPKWSVSHDAPTPCIRYGEMYSKYGEKIEEVISHTNMPTDNLRFSTGKEVLVPRVGEDPMDYAHCTWLSVPNVAIGEMISVYNTEQHPGFTAIMFNATLRYEFARRVEGFTVTNLYYDKIKEIEVSFPTLNEQTKIFQLFSQIDSLIASTQKEHDKLVTLKKCMLQKMFPKKGCLVPEIRFKGFSGDWKETFVGSIAEIITGGTPRTEEISYWEPKQIPWLSSGEVHKKIITYTDDMISDEGFDNSSAQWIKEDSILIALAGQGKTRATVAINKIPLTTNQSIAGIILNKEYDTYFTFMSLERQYEGIRKMSSGDGTRGGLNKQLVSEISLMIPSSFKEQQKIGSYFQNLDNLIFKQAEELEKLKNVKKTLLSKMFV